MGMYCACGVKLTSLYIDVVNETTTEYLPEQCTCDWSGWISTCDFPEDRKNKEISLQEMPNKSGKYLTRWSTSYGDRYEEESEFSLEPFRKDIHQIGWSDPVMVDVHWEPWNSESLIPYAWKEV